MGRALLMLDTVFNIKFIKTVFKGKLAKLEEKENIYWILRVRCI